MRASALTALALALATTGCPTTTTQPPVDAGMGGGSGGSGGGSGGGGDTGSGYYIDRSTPPPDLSTIRELEVAPMKQFTCAADAVQGSMTIADVAGATGEALVIRPAPGACSFDLVLRGAGNEATLSSSPGGYLLALARRFPEGVTVVCASDIAHHAVAGSTTLREMDRVTIRCWGSSGAAYVPIDVVVPDGDWAAWVRGLEPHPSVSGAWVLRWARDFSFQFFNMSDRGRPSTDGLYETVLNWTGSALSAGVTTRVSDRTNPFDGQPAAPWEPTPDEVRDLGGFIDFSGVP